MNCTLFPAEYGAQNIGFWRGDPDNSTYANNQSFSGMDTVFSMELILDKVNLTCNPDMRMYVAARCVFCDGTVNTDSTRYIAYYDRCPFGYNFMQGGTNGPVYAIEVLDTLNVYAGGRFDSAGVIGASNVAKWNGLTWDSLGLGVNGTVKVVLWDNNKLYVGGAFTSAGGNSASNIAVWDGVQWSTLGNGINGPVYSLTIQNGSLYAGGAFSAAGSVSANNIAKWDGSQWSDVSGGRNDEVYALAVYNNELYAGGNFTGGSTDTARYLARFGPLPNGMNEFLAGKPKSTIFPNPSTGAFSIEADEKIRTISVHTLQGEMILQKDVSQRRTEIDISNQPEGLYLIQVITKDWVEVHKIILH
ncbi:MAG: T9SS type A sorting domain-containing protein [Bacteroidia bacterium]|nr:T9SS type A sorting domain-containing protein [Bacteroidia bacterium]